MTVVVVACRKPTEQTPNLVNTRRLQRGHLAELVFSAYLVSMEVAANLHLAESSIQKVVLSCGESDYVYTLVHHQLQGGKPPATQCNSVPHMPVMEVHCGIFASLDFLRVLEIGVSIDIISRFSTISDQCFGIQRIQTLPPSSLLLPPPAY